MNATDFFARRTAHATGVDGLKTETSMATRVTSPVKRSLRLRFDRFELDESDARLTRDGSAVPLTPRVFAVLCELARTPQVLVTKNALLDAVWGHRYVSDSALKSAISTLRAALADDAKHPRYIETVSRRGYRFVGAVSTPSALPPTPARATGPLSAEENAPPLIGRASELERLRNAWRRAAAGERQIVLIAGEAGVGKTKLIERFVSEVGGLHCAHGQCVDQHGAGEPYLAVLEALTALCRRDASLADLIRTVAPTWLHQLPWLSSAAERQALQREFSGEVQAPMLREAGELLDRYTESRPLLLVTEDLHWSDRATVQLINYIARRRTSPRLLWLASFRPAELIAADHPLQAVRRELRLPGLLEEIFLDPFSEQEVSEYLAERSPTSERTKRSCAHCTIAPAGCLCSSRISRTISSRTQIPPLRKHRLLACAWLRCRFPRRGVQSSNVTSTGWNPLNAPFWKRLPYAASSSGFRRLPRRWVSM